MFLLSIITHVDDYKHRGNYSTSEDYVSKDLHNLYKHLINYINNKIISYENNKIKMQQFFTEKYFESDNHEEYPLFILKSDKTLFNDTEFIRAVQQTFNFISPGENTVP